MSHDFVTPTEAAEIFVVSRKTILSWIKKGYLRAERLPSGRYRIPSGEILKLQKDIKEGGNCDDYDEWA